VREGNQGGGNNLYNYNPASRSGTELEEQRLKSTMRNLRGRYAKKEWFNIDRAGGEVRAYRRGRKALRASVPKRLEKRE